VTIWIVSMVYTKAPIPSVIKSMRAYLVFLVAQNNTTFWSYINIAFEELKDFGKKMSRDTKLRIHNTISKDTLRYGSKLRIMNIKTQKQLEAAQMCFLKPLLGLTRRHKQRLLH
jgi:hypothetical protein